MQGKRLLRGEKDRLGHYWFDRQEVEALARKRGLQLTASGELAARVFAMIKGKHTFEDIVIQTTQHPDVITALWKRYYAGFRGEAPTNENDERARREHEEQMREMDREIERRRRSMQSDEESPPSEEPEPDSRR